VRALSSLAAVISQLCVVPLLLSSAAPFLALPSLRLFLLASVGVVGGLDDRTVRQLEPAMDPSGWRHDW
jgi:hypothetical protein